MTNALANNCGEHPSGTSIETAFGYGFQGRMDRVGATAVEMRNPAAGEQVLRHIGDFQLLLTKNHSPRKLFGEPWGEEGDRIDRISHLAARAADTPASG